MPPVNIPFLSLHIYAECRIFATAPSTLNSQLALLHILFCCNEYEDDEVVLGYPSLLILFCCNEFEDNEDMKIILHTSQLGTKVRKHQIKAG